MLRLTRKVALILALGSGLAQAAATAPLVTPEAGTPLHAALMRHGLEVMRFPGVAALLNTSVGRASPNTASALMVIRGMSRLSAGELEQRTGILSQLIPEMPLSLCAEVSRTGNSSALGQGILDALANQPPQIIDAWLQIQTLAIQRYSEGLPPQPHEPYKLDALFKTVHARLEPEDANRFANAVGRDDSSDGEMCWALQTLYRIQTRLPAAERKALARYLNGLD